MKNDTQVMRQHGRVSLPQWLCLESDEDDFLMGKTPQDMGGIEDEEE